MPGSSGTMSFAAGSLDPAVLANGILRTQLETNSLVKFSIPLNAWRVWDAIATNLPGTSASDDLGLYGHSADGLNLAFGTGAPMIRTYDVKAAGSLTLRARTQFQLPPEYKSGGLITVRFHAGMKVTVAGVAATIDVEAYKSGKDGTIGSDLCGTVAITINSTTFATKDFVIDPTGLVAGDWLDIRVTIAVNDAATGTAVIAGFGSSEVLCDVQG